MILENIGNLTTFNPDSGEVETTSNTSLVIEDGIIVEKGIGEKFDCSECLVTPGFVDPHTHPVFLDLRVDEVAMRKAGATYEEKAAPETEEQPVAAAEDESTEEPAATEESSPEELTVAAVSEAGETPPVDDEEQAEPEAEEQPATKEKASVEENPEDSKD